MTSFRTTRLIRAGLALTALTVAAVPITVPAATAAPTRPNISLPAGSRYVALGDSYSAGFGLPGPVTNQPVVGCAQSANDYPHLIATALSLNLVDATCTGAVTANIDTTAQVTTQPGGGTAPLQDTNLSASTRLVTLTIGGNDLFFASIADQCVATSAAGPLLQHPYPNCAAYLPTNPSLDPDMNLPIVVTALNRVMADIKSKAPNARIFVLEYPTISPSAANVPAAGCFRPLGLNTNAFPFTTVDVPYLNGVEARLNAAVDQAATTIGATPVATFAQTAAHSACATGADQWLNGILIGNSVLSPLPGGLHPNQTGVNFMSQQALAAIVAAFPPAPPTPTPTPTTSLPTPTPTPVPTTPTSAPTAAAQPALAATGSRHSQGLTFAGVAMLLVGGLFVLVGRRSSRRPARHR